MKCYVCKKQPGVGGTHYHVRDAVGICHHCGVAVCLEHSSRASAPGSALLCPECAQLLEQKAVVSTTDIEPA